MKQHRTLRWGLGILLALTMGLCLLAASALAETQQTADFTIGDGSDALSRLIHNNPGRAEWDNISKTLTLKGVNFAVEPATAVKLPANSTIVLADGTENTIKSTNTDNTSVENSYGIYCDGNLTIQGSGTLNVTGGAAQYWSNGISAKDNLTITGGTVNAYGGKDATSSTGIDSKSTVEITGGTVNATGGDNTNNSYGIYARDVDISGGTVNATGGDSDSPIARSVGIWTQGFVTISGDAEVTAKGGTAQSDSHGIWTQDGDVTISGGTVTVTGSTAETSSGICPGTHGIKTITISGGHVIARTLATTATDKSALHVVETLGGALDLSGYTNYQWRTSDGGAYTPSSTTQYTYSATDTYVEFKPGPATCTVSFIANGGSGSMSDVTVDSGSYILPKCGFTAPAGNKFKAWSVKGAEYAEGASIPIISDTGVVAIWVLDPDAGCYQTADFVNDPDGALALLNAAKTAGAADSTWDKTNKILTLNGVNFTTSADIAVKLPGGSKIVLAEGTNNTITSTSVNSNPWDSCNGIYVNEGNLTIEGSGELAVTGGGTAKSNGIYVAHGILIIESGTVSFTGNTASSGSYGVYADDGVEISGGIVNATGGTVNGASGSSYGISTNQSVTVTGGTVTARGGNGGYSSYGIQTGTLSADTFTVTGGTVTAIGGNASDRSHGIASRLYITISGGHVIAKTLCDAITEYRSALKPATDLSGYAGYQWRTSDSGDFTTTPYTYSDKHTYVEFSQGPITYTVSFNANGGSGTMSPVTGVSGSYTLPECGFTAPAGKQFKAWRVNDTEYAEGASITVSANTTVTAVWEDIPAITGDQTADFTTDADAALNLLTNGDTSKATWDSATKTLTLKGVRFTTTAEIAVQLPAGSKIVLAEGTNNIITSTSPITCTEPSYGICSTGNLTIGGSGTLTVTGGVTENTSRSIYATGSLTITGGTVNAYGGANANSSIGISADGVAEIRGGKVTATGSNADKASTGISAFDVVISGGTVTATGNMTNGQSNGISAHNDVTISGADTVVTATGGTAGNDSRGIYSVEGDVTISGGTVEATGSLADDSFGIYTREGKAAISGGRVIARTLARAGRALNDVPDLSGYTVYRWRTAPSGDYTASKITPYAFNETHTYVEFSGVDTANLADLPRTGDDSSLLLWIALLLASSLGVTGAVVYGKRSKC